MPSKKDAAPDCCPGFNFLSTGIVYKCVVWSRHATQDTIHNGELDRVGSGLHVGLRWVKYIKGLGALTRVRRSR